MRKVEAPLWIWLVAAEDLAHFLGRCLPALLAAQAHDYFAQIRTLMLLRALEDELQAEVRHQRACEREKVSRLCENISSHLAAVLPRLSAARQLEYREILELCGLSWQVGGAESDAPGQGQRGEQGAF